MDEYFVAAALKLAKKGMGWVNPNPMVGAVLVKGGNIIGQGYHRRVGFPHAEIECLNSCKINPEGTTLYVNLEPCAHFGKTPPCVDKIIRAGIKRVVCSTLDPNPKVHGRGGAKLKKAGIEVVTGVLADEARQLNEAFFTFHEKGRPFVAIKFAASLDGKMATKSGDSKWITNAKAREFGRVLRGQYQAVLVGINTVLLDNPHLGVRKTGKRDPVRIILDSGLQIPLSAKVLRDNNVIIATTGAANPGKLAGLKQKFDVISFDGKDIPIPKLLNYLRQKEIISILVEGGGGMLGSFVDLRLIDKVYAFHSPIIIGGKEAVSIAGRPACYRRLSIAGRGVEKISNALKLKNISYKKFGNNLLTTGVV